MVDGLWGMLHPYSVYLNLAFLRGVCHEIFKLGFHYQSHIYIFIYIKIWDRAIHSPNRQWLIQISSGELNSDESRQNRPSWRLIINHKVAINFENCSFCIKKREQNFLRDGNYIYLNYLCIMHLAI